MKLFPNPAGFWSVLTTLRLSSGLSRNRRPVIYPNENMNLIALTFGLALPAALAWTAMLLIEKDKPVLTPAERVVWALILGPAFFAFIAFLTHILGLTKLNLIGFIAPNLMVFFVLAVFAKRKGAFSAYKNRVRPGKIPGPVLSRPVMVFLGILGIWTAVKIIAGAIDLWSVPTYWDDSFNNWNMRGKLFYETERLELKIPNGNGYIQTAEGVSSYPPALPLIKTWLSTLRGGWQEPLVNGVHLVWFIGLIAAFYLYVLRKHSRSFSFLGVYMLVSLPLLLVHGMNPYAEVFLASHLFLTVISLLNAAEAQSSGESSAWLKLSAFSLGLLLFTKNESSVIYAPVILLLAAWITREKLKSGQIDRDALKRFIAIPIAILAAVGLPWLAFKWLNGLTFGNAKAVSNMGVGFSFPALKAIWFQLSSEPNWLFLPLLLPVILFFTGKNSFKYPQGLLTVFILICFAVQVSIFIIAIPLAREAVMQTGFNRGLLHLAPLALLLMILSARRLIWEPD